MTDGRQYQAIHRAALRECEARLEARDREIDALRAELEATLRALRYLHNFPNAPAAHANAAKIIPSDAEFDRMARANDAATPPPESEPCKRCNGRGTTHKDDGICGQFPCKRCDGNGNDPDAPHTPEHHWEYYYKVNHCSADRADDPECICWHREGTGPLPNARHDDPDEAIPKGWRYTDAPQQAHGDALESLYRLSSYTADDYCDSQHARWHDTAVVRRHLTASGVPERGDVSLDQYEKVRRERDNLAAAIRSMPIPELPHKTAIQLVEAFDRYEEKRGPGTLGWRAESMQAAWCLVQRSPAAWR